MEKALKDLVNVKSNVSKNCCSEDMLFAIGKYREYRPKVCYSCNPAINEALHHIS